MERTITVKLTLTDSILDDILCTALEGGIGYWAVLCNDHKDWRAARKRIVERKTTDPEDKYIPTYSEVALEVLNNGDAIYFEDAEGEGGADDRHGNEGLEDCPWKMTMEDLMSGIREFTEDSSCNIINCIERGDFDADDADQIIQYALFKEVVFG